MISSSSQIFRASAQPQISAGERSSARIGITQEPRSRQGQGLKNAILRSGKALNQEEQTIDK